MVSCLSIQWCVEYLPTCTDLAHQMVSHLNTPNVWCNYPPVIISAHEIHRIHNHYQTTWCPIIAHQMCGVPTYQATWCHISVCCLCVWRCWELYAKCWVYGDEQRKDVGWRRWRGREEVGGKAAGRDDEETSKEDDIGGCKTEAERR
jgi:hypothetical protein